MAKDIVGVDIGSNSIHMVVVEVQSWRYHGALVDREADAVRVKQLEAAGFTVVEITDDEVWSQPWQVVRKVEAGIELDRSLRA